MNPLSPWVAFTEICLLLTTAFLIGFGLAWVRARPALRRVKSSIREAERDLKALDNQPGAALKMELTNL